MKQTFIVPLYIRVGVKKPKNIWISLNNYRNWQFHQNNDYKIEFKRVIAYEMSQLKKMKGLVDVRIKIWYPDLTDRDLDNNMSIITKFTLDALVFYGILEEDNINYIRSIHGSFNGFSRENPRAEVTLDSVRGESTQKWKEDFYLQGYNALLSEP